MKEKIYISNDHTGVEMKKAIVKHLKDKGYQVVDMGVDTSEACNYSFQGFRLGEAVVKDKNALGIAICGTGVGISIAANKVKGVRAGLVYETQTARLIRQHNNANILATGARMIAVAKAVDLVEEFLNAKFEGGRHKERVGSIDDYGSKN